ncbi:MAG: hypothetical protein JST73_04395, partial [Actinobacteria bacterium]|nr:hypothetical protein [Actinomycetota bacterium]
MSSTGATIATDGGGLDGFDGLASRAKARRLDDVVIFRIAAVVAASPIMIAAIRNGMHHWTPYGDAALSVVWIRDVFSSHPPLIGLPSYPSMATRHPYNYPGALLFYLMAVPVRVLGPTWGTLLGMGVLNTTWFLGALWLIRRRVGYRYALVACLFGGSLIWSLGSQILVDVTPLQAGSLAFMALLAAAWSVADGDDIALVPLALTANFLVLTHLKFALVVPLVCAVAVGSWWFRTHRARRTCGAGGDGSRRRRRWVWTVVAVVTAVAWFPPVVQQVLSVDGNLGNLVRSSAGGGEHRVVEVTVLHAIGAVSSPMTTIPLWFRDSLAHPNFDGAGPTTSPVLQVVGGVAVLALVVFVFLACRRRGTTTITTGIFVAAVAWCGWVVSVVVNPNPFGITFGYLFEVWPLAMFVWMLSALGIARLLRERRVRSGHPTYDRSARRAAMLGLVAFAVASIPIANLGAETPQAGIPVARDVRRVLRSEVTGPTPVLVRSTIGMPRLVPVVVLDLVESGVSVKVERGWPTRQYRAFRTFRGQPSDAPRTVVVSSIPLPALAGRTVLYRPRFSRD